MYSHTLYQQINQLVQEEELNIAGVDNSFYSRMLANIGTVQLLYSGIYADHPKMEACFQRLCRLIIQTHKNRPDIWRLHDDQKLKEKHWFLSQKLVGMSLYVDRFCEKLSGVPNHLSYLEELGVNLLHLMPLFDSPSEASDGGYAVRNFRKINPHFGSLQDLQHLREELRHREMYLMLDIVLNHTSDQHEWALKAKAGDRKFQEFFYFFPDRQLPDLFEAAMPEIFPDAAPGNFTYVKECDQWVMSVFHQYQWDLNYRNPDLFLAMLENVFFYANLGVDILRIDAPAFIWKEPGTSCQNLPQVHQLLRLIRQCVEIATPGMALLGEAIVAPQNIIEYFGTGDFKARECDFAYNATQMALQWDMLATGDTRIMLAAQDILVQKPYGSSWITYTRCHDDIGLGFNDSSIREAGWDPYAHRHFLQQYYSGQYAGSPARGALFSSNPKTGDARISGSLASLCGLESALEQNEENLINTAIQKILLMQAHSFFLGGLPMLYYGDEAGYTNDYSFESDPARSYDNRWMHRPLINWNKNARKDETGSVEYKIFQGTAKLAKIRRSLPLLADHSNLKWLPAYNRHMAGFVRSMDEQQIFAIFNFHGRPQGVDWNLIADHYPLPTSFRDHWSGRIWNTEKEALLLQPYQFVLLTALQ